MLLIRDWLKAGTMASLCCPKDALPLPPLPCGLGTVLPIPLGTGSPAGVLVGNTGASTGEHSIGVVLAGTQEVVASSGCWGGAGTTGVVV